MIFVILGTQDKQFVRLLKEIEALIEDGVITKQVIVQAGATKYKSKRMELHKMISMEAFLNYIEKSDYIITHGGVGSILDAMRKNKKIIAVPRLKAYGEHENDHQIQIIEKFTQGNYIIGCHDVKDLKNAIQRIDTFEPNNCTLGNEKMVKQIEDFIKNTEPCKRQKYMIYTCLTVISLLGQMLLYYMLNQVLSGFDAMFLSWICAYIFLVLTANSKKKYRFEILFGVLLACSQILWLNLWKDCVILMFLSTFLCAIVAYIGHAIYYGGKR